jgi:hypothetical protein
MDFSIELNALQQQVDQTKSATEAAATESREQLKRRIQQARIETDTASQETRQSGSGGPQSKWAKMKADANDKMSDVKARIDKRNKEADATMTAVDADWAESDAADAIDYAAWSVNNARLAILNAIDARAEADAAASGGPG